MEAASPANEKLDVAVVILTKNEEKNVARAVNSVVGRVKQVFVLDSGSTDRTIEIAKSCGAEVFENPWPGYAAQRNWALDHLPINSTWVFYLDADEFVDDAFLDEFGEAIRHAPPNVAGFSIRRWLEWGDARVAWGGMQDTRILRALKFGAGRCDDRVVNEHLVVNGDEADLDTPVGHRNESGVWRWVQKHRHYAPLEARALLDELLHPTPPEGPLARSRLLKRRVYAALPPFARSFARFGYAMVVQKGYKDGVGGGVYHVLHDLVYMLVIDAHFVAEAAKKAVGAESARA